MRAFTIEKLPMRVAGGLLVATLALLPARLGAEEPTAPAAPPVPSPSAPDAAPPSPEALMEERFRKLEERYNEMDRRHAEEYKALSDKYERLRGQVESGGAGARSSGGAPNAGTNRQPGGETSAPAARSSGRTGDGRDADAQGTDGRTHVREAPSRSSNKTPAKVQFDEGLEFSSDDDEFKLTFHDLTQAEYRGFPTRDHGTLQDQFFVPRQRWYFTGQATRSVEYYTSINRGYGSLDLLDAFITLNFLESIKNDEDGSGAGGQGRSRLAQGRETDARLRLRVGRMKTPYLYEYFAIAEGDLIAPERSLYAGNLAGNRQIGAMLLGDLFEQRLGYATGIFNGPRRSFGDFNSDKDLFFRFNARPFLKSERFTALRYLNFGGDVNGGFENNPTQPTAFRTANDQTSSSSAASLSPTFLTLNNNVTEVGLREQWAGHVAYFYKSLMLLSEVAGGTQGYSINGKDSTQISNQGWMIQGTYFVTGEQPTRRVNLVRPVHDFGFHKGKFGLGAIEVHGRYSEMGLNHQLFAAGFADPNQWTNRAAATDIGVNWYLNYYTKIYFDWQHAMFGNPVASGSGSRLLSTTDLFWLRFQLFF